MSPAVQFDNIARDVIASSRLRGRAIFDNLESVSAHITSYAVTTGAKWPFVVIPHFQVTAMVSNGITGASTLGFSPIVMDEHREAWQNFSLQTSMAWLAEGHMYDEEANTELYVETRYPTDSKAPFPVPYWNESGIFPFIFQWDSTFTRPVVADRRPFYIPSWQTAPAPDYTIQVNLDTYSNPFSAVFNDGVIKHKKPVLSNTITADYLRYIYDDRFDVVATVIPHSYVYYPIFDTFKEDRQVVAMLNAFLRWDQFFFNVLPEGEKPVHVVLDSTCREQIFTYELQGDRAYFLGDGDLHDTRYNHVTKSSAFQAEAQLDDVDGFSCEYTMHLYPTAQWSQDYFTNKPYVYAVAVISCFLVTTLVFVIYDCVVQKRNRTVMESATKTNQIVSSRELTK
jgi:hypothetical protein